MGVSSTSAKRREFCFFFIFALAIWCVNMRYVDSMQGTAASEWMTATGILQNPDSYKNSLQYLYFSEINSFADSAGVWLNSAFGLSIVALDKGRTLVQTIFIVFGVWLLCVSIGRVSFTAVIAILFIFASCFTWLGRYLNLQVTYIPTHSGVAFAFGLFILGLFANGRRVIPVLLSCLLFIWHPSHSVILHSFMWVYMVANYRREGGFKSIAKYAAFNFLFLIPSFLATRSQFSSLSAQLSAHDIALWWKLLEARTTNVFPLNDGALIVANVWMSIAAGYLILFFAVAASRKPNAEKSRNGMMFSVFVMIWIGCLWCAQIAAAHFLQIMPVTRLALTRCTPYAVVYMCIFTAAAVEDIWNRREKWAVVFPAVAVVAGFLIRLQAPLIVAFMAYYASRSMQGRYAKLFRYAGLICFILLVSSGALIHAIDTFELFSGGLYAVVRRLSSATLFLSMILAGAILGVSVLFIIFRRDSLSISTQKHEEGGWLSLVCVALITIVALSCNLFMQNKGAKYDLRFIANPMQKDADARRELQEWASNSTPAGAMFIFNPMLFSGFEQTAKRPGLIAREEIHYPLYAIGLIGEVVFRLKLMGIDVSNEEFDKKCGLINSLKIPRCRQSMFYKELEANYPKAVIENTNLLMNTYENARYLVVEKGKDIPAGFREGHPMVYRNRIFRVYDLKP